MSFIDVNYKDIGKLANGKVGIWVNIKFTIYHIGYHRALAILIGAALLTIAFNWMVGVAALCLAFGVTDITALDLDKEMDAYVNMEEQK